MNGVDQKSCCWVSRKDSALVGGRISVNSAVQRATCPTVILQRKVTLLFARFGVSMSSTLAARSSHVVIPHSLDLCVRKTTEPAPKLLSSTAYVSVAIINFVAVSHRVQCRLCDQWLHCTRTEYTTTQKLSPPERGCFLLLFSFIFHTLSCSLRPVGAG